MWRSSYRVVTVPASPEVARYQERHGPIFLRRQVMHWLDGAVPETDVLRTSSPRTFAVTEIDAPLRQALLL